ncbi:effector-associated constant component EACC1 [Phytomonospora endophytica]|uniref:Uncharacterized protein n=1 Tax=Phytomonospora endophytica TaxID=714109 RepID=A0A841FLZ6_9ACTN|nr:hypothetical protein [Phytomonospora endophytica]MBB6034207.1 hypothetical protein [Phytomonospora endophytica]GIG66599.1 hypothetical protein Pen01_28940 [Phytomonospora endophytica]
MEVRFTVASSSRQLDGEDLYRALARTPRVATEARLTRIYGSGAEGQLGGVLETILAVANTAAAVGGAVAATGAWLTSRRTVARQQDRPLEITVECGARRVVLSAGTPEEVRGALGVLGLLEGESPE